MKYSEDKFCEIAQSHVQLFNELEARDVVFRYEFNTEERRQLAPWIMLGRERFQQEEFDICIKLQEKIISEIEALEQITKLMERYYGKKYPLKSNPHRSTMD